MNASRTNSISADTDPYVIVGFGMPGSGKTTLLKPLAERNGITYINRDDIRKELFGDPMRQANKNVVWEEADRRLQAALASGSPVIYDATFSEVKKRRDFVQSLRDMGWKRIVGFYVDTPIEIAKERNKNREHVVPEDELEKYFIQPLAANPPSLEDGFDELYHLNDAELLEQRIKEG